MPLKRKTVPSAVVVWMTMSSPKVVKSSYCPVKTWPTVSVPGDVGCCAAACKPKHATAASSKQPDNKTRILSSSYNFYESRPFKSNSMRVARGRGRPDRTASAADNRVLRLHQLLQRRNTGGGLREGKQAATARKLIGEGGGGAGHGRQRRAGYTTGMW